MNPARLRPRVPATGRVTLRLSPAQRDRFLRAPGVPRALAHALRNAPVREGWLAARVARAELDALAVAVADAMGADRRAARELASLARYLETMERRFLEPSDEAGPDAAPEESR